jgi:hypothetical protein
LYRASTAMVIGYRASRRCRLVARPPAARSSAITAELTDYLQQRIIQYDTAKPIEACPACVTE